MLINKKIASRVLVVQAFISPFFVLIGLLIYQILHKNKDAGKLNSIVGAIFLSFVNSTKAIEEDLVEYKRIYDLIPAINFYENLFRLDYGRDFGYQLVNYVGYYITIGEFRLFLFIVNFLSFYFLIKGMVVLHERLGICDKYSIPFVITVIFFPPMFVMSGHLFRQHVAVCMMVYAVSLLITRTKYWWIYAMFAISIHSVSSVFVVIIPIIYILVYVYGVDDKSNQIKMRISNGAIVLIIIAFSILVFVAVLGGFLPILLEKIQAERVYDISMEQGYELSVFSNHWYLLIFLLGVISSCVVIIKKPQGAFIGLSVFVLLACVFFYMTSDLFLGYRILHFRVMHMFPYIWIFIPALIYYSIFGDPQKKKIYLDSLILELVSILLLLIMPILFYLGIRSSHFSYVPIVEIMIHPVIGLL